MQIVDPKIYIPEKEVDSSKIKKVERYARVCYKSEDRMRADNNSSLVGSLIKRGHESVIEHEKITVLLVIDRGLSHEVVRHRLASYSQESTRYCNYQKDKFGNEITVIKPFYYKERNKEYHFWKEACEYAERKYLELINSGSTAQEARAVLPNSLKTEIVVTYNLREWRHFLKLRGSKAAHPQAQQIAIPLLLKFQELLPGVFDDIPYDLSFDKADYAHIIFTDELFND